MNKVDPTFERLKEAMRHEPADTPLGRAVARLREPFILGEGNQFHYEKFVVMMAAIREVLHEIDPTISSGIDASLLRPATIAQMFGIPLEQFNYQGDNSAGVDPAVVKQLKQIVALLETDVNPASHRLNDLEQEIVDALGNDTLTGEKIAERADRNYDSTFKTALASLRRRNILGNKSPGYHRL